MVTASPAPADELPDSRSCLLSAATHQTDKPMGIYHRVRAQHIQTSEADMPAHVKIGSVMGSGAQVYAPVPRHAATLTTTTSAQTTFSATSGDYASVTAIDAAVMVAIGANPTAIANGAGMHRVEAGAIMDFGPLKDGDKIAAIDAA